MEIMELGLVCLIGAAGYGGLELLWRGYTHWTMLVLGGLCFLLIYAIATRLRRLSPMRKWTLCAAGITLMEFCTGCAVNLRLGWNVWDYGGVPGNLLGQICPRYALLWFLLSVPCCGLSRFLRRVMMLRVGKTIRKPLPFRFAAAFRRRGV